MLLWSVTRRKLPANGIKANYSFIFSLLIKGELPAVKTAGGLPEGKCEIKVTMKRWLKIFGLSFFSDETASGAAKGGFVIVAVSLLLSFMFFLLGYYGADVAPFSAKYNGAQSYKQFINGAFSQINVEIKDGKAVSDKLVNSYSSDKEYSLNGYNLIVDTRPSDTLIQFTQSAVKGESEISYEEYRRLNADEKKNYRIVTRYTDKQLEITDEAVKSYENFLSAEEAAQKEFFALDKNAEDYQTKLYLLYVRHYYTSATSIMYGAEAPVLRDYYYRNYIADGNAYYFYVFDSMLAGSFKTESGVPVVFGGYFNGCANGKVGDIHALIKDVYYGTAGNLFPSYFVGAVSQLPVLIIAPIVLALIMWGIGKAVKDGWEKTFGGCFKIVSSFVWVSALITALTAFACGWFVAARLMYSLMPVIFGGVLLIRTAIYCVLNAVKSRKQSADTVAQNNLNDIFGGEL